MNPVRPDCMQQQPKKAAKMLAQCYDKLFECFWGSFCPVELHVLSTLHPFHVAQVLLSRALCILLLLQSRHVVQSPVP